MCIDNVGFGQRQQTRGVPQSTDVTFDARFYSQNVRGLNIKLKRQKVFMNFENKADIIFVQESHSTKKIETEWDEMWDGDIVYSHGTSASRGCMIMFKRTVDHVIVDSKRDKNGRYVFVKCNVQGQKMFLANVYAPNKENEHKGFLKELIDNAKAYYEDDYRHIVFGGDWNFIENLKDKKGGVQQLWQDSVAQINLLREHFDLVDIWRIQNEEKLQYTWHSNTTPKIFTRLDRFYISDSLQSSIKNSKISPGLCSDHSATSFHLQCNSTILGPGFWKLNTHHLTDIDFVNKINETIAEVIETANTESLDKRGQWDFLKYKVKETAIRESKIRAKNKREEIRRLEANITHAENILLLEPHSHAASDIKKQAEKALDDHHTAKTKSLIVQSRSQFYEEGEKNSKFFLNLVKSNQEKALIKSLKVGDETVTDQKRILNEMEMFYKTLYTSKETESADIWIDEIKQESDIPQINDERNDELASELTKESLAQIIKSCPKNKAPGNDGLPKEFYVIFWNKIAELLLDALKESIEKGEMSTSQKQSIIRLIPKKDRDKQLIKNWRPLNLINSDTKFYTKWVAKKIIPSLNDVIHSNQAAYVKGRFIGEGIKTIEGVIHFIREHKLDGYILAIDFEKAFDSIEWDYLWKGLETFGYPDAYIKLIKVAYNNMEACVLNGGTTTKFFRITRGVRQGDPISAYLFIVALELLAIKIRNNKSIKGVVINGVEIKLSAYADDISLFTTDFQSVINIFQELERFSKMSGLRCNKEKTECLRLGKSNMEHERGVEVKWVNFMKITGITFDIQGISKTKNTEDIVEKLEKQLSMWTARQISLIGRAQIMKTFGYSKLRFLTNMMDISQELLKIIKRTAYNFLWNGSEKGKVKRNSICADINKGGIRFPDLDAIIKTQHLVWVKRFIFSPYHPWKEIFTWQMSKLGGAHILENSALQTKLIKDYNLIPFYEKVIVSWSDWISCQLDENNVLEQQLYLNQHITRPNKQAILYPRLIKKGIVRINDIIDEANKIKTGEIMRIEKQLSPVEFMQYISVLQCIGGGIKTFLQQRIPSNLIPTNKQERLKKMTSKQLYESVLSKTISRPTSEEKLSQMLSLELNENDWENVYRLPFLATIESKLRSFQFKINHNIYYTNKKLKDVNIIESAECSFCKSEIETLEHLFSACIHVSPLWNYLSSILINTHSINTLNTSQKLLGLYEMIERNNYDVVNHLTLTLKYHIHLSKFREILPSIAGFKELIKDTEMIEKRIATRKHKLNRHHDKWDDILSFLA